MSNNDIIYLDPKKLLVVESVGKIKQLYVPIRMTTNVQLNPKIPSLTIVYIEEIQKHRQYRIVYRVFGRWYPYWAFNIK
jgi:hypothetical protein